MTTEPTLRPGPPATPDDLHRAQYQEELLEGGELERIRSAALAWRNGLAGLIAGLIGFGLVKGRSDVTQLAPGAAAAVGVLLGLATLFGTLAAWLVLRAAHGLPRVVPAEQLPGRVTHEHQLATAAARDLRRGSALVVVHATLLIAAVAVTWYGPERAKPQVTVVTPDVTACGTVRSVGGGALTVRTRTVEMRIPLDQVLDLTAVEACPPR
ncbi:MULTISPECIES: hypothetical protein [unclassified Streptomyces]|uniref:hypothetical protein n=1 Tax=unclassified Streptomyces TaxID=2593676 RepID=UPI002E0F7314|nr:hypothetical protein OG457_30735 [Streptomyces sp. NBC_01207]WTA20969.1 hypothetical protein OG365_24640 [Streptomyces sp. NBC_00853]